MTILTTLPTVQSLEDCADFSKTVEPFLPQLYDLPYKLLDAVSSRSSESILDIYVNTNPLISGFAFSVFLGFVFLVGSEINRNYSQVDRFWSLLPTVYNIHFAAWAHLTGIAHQRLDLVAAFSTIWSVRLTYNYWRKGGYSIGSEDYRWAIIKSKVHPILFFLFNVTFISFIQSVLLFSLAAPTYIVLLSSQIEPDVSSVDLAFGALELGLIVSEWFSDQQQWDYQNAKQEYQKTAKLPKGWRQDDLDRGFITNGLWAYSRHPNFAAEQTIWYILYQWSCYASKVLYNWTGTGAVFLVMLFQGSTWLTEVITSGKYPEYKMYQKKVGCFIPTSFTPYKAPVQQPKIIRTSELAKKQK